ncbi:substrate-binding periplasmic protein [Chelatococcus sp. GCM10030263]|uniref:substrate-binding periplasmic protein n=1 Tax=Chelatococcus sp. GCM10030263 TaxID=3273387 RepID=UPI003608DE8C
MKWSKLFLVAVGMLGAAIVAPAARAQTADGYWQEVQKRGVLRCGAAIAPPHVMRDPLTGAYSGLFVDFCNEFAEKALGVKAEMVDTTWDNIVAGLQAGRWDLSMAINRTPKRALAIAFSAPVWAYQISLVYDKANPKLKDPKSLADVDVAGVTIAVKTGSAEDAAMTANVKNATIMRLADVDANRLAVSSRRADIVVEDSDANALFVATDPNRWVAMFPQPAVAKQGIAYGLRRSATAADVDVLNIFLEEKAATGQTATIFQTYVDKIVGGTK